LQEVTFSPGQVVIQQGDVGDSFYIIKSGNANVVKIGADGMSIEVH
jgi:cAMP-dependent protein kinase regulator